MGRPVTGMRTPYTCRLRALSEIALPAKQFILKTALPVMAMPAWERIRVLPWCIKLTTPATMLTWHFIWRLKME